MRGKAGLERLSVGGNQLGAGGLKRLEERMKKVPLLMSLSS